MSTRSRSYDKEFIKESVHYALAVVSIAQAAKDLGLPEATLHGWVKKPNCPERHYIEGYYNKKRMHSSIDYKTPVEVECFNKSA